MSWSLKKIIKFQPAAISLLFTIIGVFAYLIGIPFLDLVELKTIDLRFKSRGASAPGNEVVLAVIDEKSIDREGKWIWPRSRIATLVEKLSAAGAKVIAFDIGFLDPDEKSVIKTIERIGAELPHLDETTRAFLEKIKYQSDNDLVLAQAIERSGAKVVLGHFFQMAYEHEDDYNQTRIDQNEASLRGAQYNVVHFTTEAAQAARFVEAKAANPNILQIAEAADNAGYFNMFPDPDGVVRWIPAVIKYQAIQYAPLSLMTVAAYLDTTLGLTVAEYGVVNVQIGDTIIPTDELGRVLINYRGPEKTFLHVSITDILNDQVPAVVFQDKIVLIGATAIGIYDLRVMPFSAVFPGLEIHANIIDSVLKNDFLRQPNWTSIFDIAAILAAGLILCLVLPRSGVFTGAGLAGALFVGHIVFCQYLFSGRGVILNMVYPLMVIVAVYISLTAYKYLIETRQKRFIRNAFSTYLAPTVVQQLIDSPQSLELGGEEREITAFFSDVQGFTGISESLGPHELVELLNEFLTQMTDIILKHEGTVDKFEGDAIIAFFGAPNVLPNQAQTACLTCVEMQNRLVELRQKWKSEGRPELFMRIGLCTGPAVVGNMGSASRMDYTMMGDTVNTAARLEGVNKIYGNYTLMCENTYQKAQNSITAREIDAIKVVGKTVPITIYEIVGKPDEMTEHQAQTIGFYAKGLTAYRRRKWGEALKYFQAALKITPMDGPSLALAARCRAYQTSPPAEDWDGAYVMQTK